MAEDIPLTESSCSRSLLFGGHDDRDHVDRSAEVEADALYERDGAEPYHEHRRIALDESGGPENENRDYSAGDSRRYAESLELVAVFDLLAVKYHRVDERERKARNAGEYVEERHLMSRQLEYVNEIRAAVFVYHTRHVGVEEHREHIKYVFFELYVLSVF